MRRTYIAMHISHNNKKKKKYKYKCPGRKNMERAILNQPNKTF